MDNVIKKLKPNIGLDDTTREASVDLMKTVLADQHVLYMKLRNYHWNVTGPHFIELHELFEDQYDDLAEAIDSTAERIRQYGAPAPGTFAEMLELARLTEDPGVVPSTREMLENLVSDHETMVQNLRGDTDKADDLDDIAVEDYFTQLVQDHQKMAWMLRAHLEGDNL